MLFGDIGVLSLQLQCYGLQTTTRQTLSSLDTSKNLKATMSIFSLKKPV